MRTSATDPIRVDFIPRSAHGLAGRLGMTFAPGKKAPSQEGTRWDRDLKIDLARLRAEYEADVLVSLLEEDELRMLQLPTLVAEAGAAGIEIDRYEIPDGGVPGDAVAFARLVSRTVSRVRGGKTVVIHCRGGWGRTGVLAALRLRAVAIEAERAMHHPGRRADPGCSLRHWKNGRARR